MASHMLSTDNQLRANQTHKERYERGKGGSGTPTSSEVISSNPTRRSLRPTFEKENCFFCDEEGSKRNPPDFNNNDTLKVRLNEALTH